MTDVRITRAELEKALNRLTEKAGAEGGWGRKKWTVETKMLLVDLGNRKGCQTCASKIESATWPREWLYDVVWLQAKGAFLVEDIRLVAEIEWGNAQDVWEDFQKLLVARSDHRVMIFDDKPGLQGELIRLVRTFRKRGPDDKYYLASYADDKFTVHEVK